VSWTLYAVPLHALSRDGMSDWIAAAQFTRGLPDDVPPTLPLPSIVEVLDAFRAAGCHGTNWFEIVGEEAGTRLPECPSPGHCAGGLDLGEVSVYTTGATSSLPAVAADAPVETVTFRKPDTGAALRAVCALAARAGPQLVFDVSGDDVFVIRPGEQVARLRDEWPW